jgi:hypothetical protein
MDAHRPVDIANPDPELAFHELVALNDGSFGVFRATGAGRGPWEMHPGTDELLFARQRTVTIEMFDERGNEHVPLLAGGLVVAPRGRWHRAHVDALTSSSCTTLLGPASAATTRPPQPPTTATDDTASHPRRPVRHEVPSWSVAGQVGHRDARRRRRAGDAHE